MSDFKIRTTLNTIKKHPQKSIQLPTANINTETIDLKKIENFEKNEIKKIENQKVITLPILETATQKLETIEEDKKLIIEDKKELKQDNILILANEMMAHREKTFEEKKAEIETKRQLWMQLKKDTMLEHRILNKPTDKRRLVSKLNLIKARQARTENAIQRRKDDTESKRKLEEYLDASNDDDTEDSEYKEELNLGRKAYKQKQKILEKQKNDELASLKEMIFLFF